MTVFGRAILGGLSSLRDRAAARLAGFRFNPSRFEFRPDSKGEFDELYAEFAGGNVFIETLDRNAVYIGFQWIDGRYCQLWVGCTGRGRLTYHHEDGRD